MKVLAKRIWERAKAGVVVPVGPLALCLRLARKTRISANRHWRMRARPVPIEARRERPVANVQSATREIAIIVGVGPGLGAALARRFAKAGMHVALAARQTEKLTGLLEELRAMGVEAEAFACDASREAMVQALFRHVLQHWGVPTLVVFNVEAFGPGSITEIEVSAFEDCWRAMTLGGFLVGREAARAMMPNQRGTILFTGATASTRGRAGYINMTVGKSGVRALAQSMARELGPLGIHVAHIVLDGGILSPRSPDTAETRMSSLFPEAIADNYLALHQQHPSTWTQELDLRPWVEKF